MTKQFSLPTINRLEYTTPPPHPRHPFFDFFNAFKSLFSRVKNMLMWDTDSDTLADGFTFTDINGDGYYSPVYDEITERGEDFNGDRIIDPASESCPLSSDTDGDGVPDNEEDFDLVENYWYDDGDGDYHINAQDKDSDNDGLPDGAIDGWGWKAGENPGPDTIAMTICGEDGAWGYYADKKNNLIDDDIAHQFSGDSLVWISAEYEDKNCDGDVDDGESNPLSTDTDDDQIDDGVEVGGQYITLNQDTFWEKTDIHVYSYPADDDSDSDGSLSDTFEWGHGLDPRSWDTDDDGKGDDEEVENFVAYKKREAEHYDEEHSILETSDIEDNYIRLIWESRVNYLSLVVNLPAESDDYKFIIYGKSEFGRGVEIRLYDYSGGEITYGTFSEFNSVYETRELTFTTSNVWYVRLRMGYHYEEDNEALIDWLKVERKGTNPASVDSDGDGIADVVEIENGLLPWYPQDGSCGDVGFIDADISGSAGIPDCYVNIYDLALMSEQWLNDSAQADILGVTDFVDILDYSLMAKRWLSCNDPSNIECW